MIVDWITLFAIFVMGFSTADWIHTRKTQVIRQRQAAKPIRCASLQL